MKTKRRSLIASMLTMVGLAGAHHQPPVKVYDKPDFDPDRPVSRLRRRRNSKGKTSRGHWWQRSTPWKKGIRRNQVKAYGYNNMSSMDIQRYYARRNAHLAALAVKEAQDDQA